MKKQFEITNIEAFQKSWATIQRRAKKLGLAVPVATAIGEPYFKKVKKIIASEHALDRVHEYVVEVQLYEIDQISYTFDGWALVGIAEPIKGTANLLVPTSDFSSQWSAVTFRHTNSGQVCEHCNMIRCRSKVYVVGRTDDFNVTKQVGSSCLADFCSTSSGNVAAAFEFESLIYETLREYDWEGGEGGGKSRVHAIAPISVLQAACEVSITTGYVSRAKSEQNGTYSTADLVKRSYSENPDKKDLIQPSENAHKRAEKVLEWAMAEGPAKAETDSYWNGVMQFLNLELVPMKRLGYIVGLVGCYDAYLRAQERAAGNSASEFQGKVGDRITFEATIMRVSTFESNFGQGTITLAKTADGHILKYWNYIGEQGGTYQFSAGIKAHEDDKFINAKVTVLSRCTKIKSI